MADRPHFFLNNPRGQKKHFNASRKVDPAIVPDSRPEAYRKQKDKLNYRLQSVEAGRRDRILERTLTIPDHLEYLEVHFFVIFNDNEPYKTKSNFKRFGLIPVIYRNFNQSVVFAISDGEKFNAFIKLLNEFINSSDDVSPKNTNYSISTIIYDFEFLSTSNIEGYIGDNVVLSLVNRSEDIKREYDSILASLLEHLKSLSRSGIIEDFSTDEHSTIEIKNISRDQVSVLTKNFDVIFKIQSLRIPTIANDEFNIPHLTWNITIAPPENDIIIGIIDNGVRRIAPLQNIILASTLDITNPILPNPNNTNHTHGTVVGSLAALGADIFNPDIKAFVADAFILPIKIINDYDGFFNIYDIEKMITRAAREGVRIFNLSVCGPTINYNSAVSEYAYLLDKLAYQLDIIIFIATGNLQEDDMAAMNEPGNEHELHHYPNHFFNPNSASDFHNCEATNICTPAESYNNITVGAIADNFNKDSSAHLTPFKELPAYYTRKHYLNPLAKINETHFQDSQKNKNINKPDIVMPGGDRFNASSGLQVFGFGLNGNDFYQQNTGTSLAAPLAANLAAKILKQYGSLKMQSVKALILNSAQQYGNSSFLNELELKIKEEESQKMFGLPYDSLHTRTQKPIINKLFSSDSLYKSLVGFGMPQVEKMLYSDDKSVTIMIEDVISSKTYKAININIPPYLLQYSKDSPIISVEATLCYKFFPIWGNQLAYNPLHISFNFVNHHVIDQPAEIAEILSDSKHVYFEQFYTEDMNDDERRAARKTALGIKKDLQSWSEDFYPPANKPFSNVQKLKLLINKNEINKVNQQITLAVRCTHKQELEREMVEFLAQKNHEFSIALTITEKPNQELSDFSLYDEMELWNNLEPIAGLELNGDLNAEFD